MKIYLGTLKHVKRVDITPDTGRELIGLDNDVYMCIEDETGSLVAWRMGRKSYNEVFVPAVRAALIVSMDSDTYLFADRNGGLELWQCRRQNGSWIRGTFRKRWKTVWDFLSEHGAIQ